MVQWLRICLQYRRHTRCGFDPWVRKIPWRRKWQPTPIFLPEQSHGLSTLASYSPWDLSRTQLSDWACTTHRVLTLYSWEETLGEGFLSSRQFTSLRYWDIDPLRVHGLVTCCFHLRPGETLSILPTYTPLCRTSMTIFYLCHDIKRLGSSGFC